MESAQEDKALDPPLDRPLVRYPIKKYRALIDAEDLRTVQAHQWMIDRDGYARSRTGGFLHRLVMNVGDLPNPVDHINRNRLDCRKCNLRVITGSRNNLNTSQSVEGGVRIVPGGYAARVTYRKVYYHLGTFETSERAKQVRDDAVKRIMDGETHIVVWRGGLAVLREITHD